MERRITIFCVVVLALMLMASTTETGSGVIDLNNLFNYANQEIPDYITKDNTPEDNQITDLGATLGRVLFYDKKLSSDNTVSCASCHSQEFAFSDLAMQSTGVNDITPRHSMRLINARFSDEDKFFWDERAGSLEEQASMPIQDHGEMGFSGTNGDPDFSDLVDKLNEVDYYESLFTAAFGDPNITEERIQKAIAQFVRSIQSFDSKYDEGRAQVASDMDDFPNYTASENAGKALFMGDFEYVIDTLWIEDDTGGDYYDSVAWRTATSPGLGCASCHRPPEFDIDPSSLSNGKVRDIYNAAFEYGITRAPTLRDVLGADGSGNGPFFHSGLGTPDNNINAMVFEHYNRVRAFGDLTEYDPRVLPEGKSMFLNLTGTEQAQLKDFIETLTGSDVYTNEKWSDPFDAEGNLTVINESGKLAQTITFDALEAKTYGDSEFDLTASASSGLTVTYTSSEEAVATINGNTVTILAAGTTTITASQPGDDDYNAATSVSQTLMVYKVDQVITFDEIADVDIASVTSITLSATASSELELSYEIIEGTEIASVTGSEVTLTGTGLVTIEASQQGNDNYNAVNASRSFTVADSRKTDQTITFDALETKTYGDTPFDLAATASSELAVTYTSSDETVATINGSTVIIVGAGTTTITASQAGNDDFNEAESVSQDLVVSKAGLTITADDKEMSTGEPVPDLTMSFDGFVNGDTEDNITLPSITTEATGELSGTFDIVLDGGEAVNYDLTLSNGVLTIVGEPETILALEGKQAIMISPNPSYEKVMIEGALSNTSIVLINLEGKKIARYVATSNELTIDLSGLKEGIYLITQLDETGNVINMKKVIKRDR